MDNISVTLPRSNDHAHIETNPHSDNEEIIPADQRMVFPHSNGHAPVHISYNSDYEEITGVLLSGDYEQSPSTPPPSESLPLVTTGRLISLDSDQKFTIATFCLANLCIGAFYALLAPFFPVEVSLKLRKRLNCKCIKLKEMSPGADIHTAFYPGTLEPKTTSAKSI